MSAPLPDPGYEPRDARIGPLLAVLGSILGLVIVAFAVGGLVDVKMSEEIESTRAAPSPMREFREPPRGPALETVPGRVREAYELEMQQRLDSAAWVDPEAGVVSIPIDRAIDLLLERGLPHRDAAPQGGEE